MAVIRTIMDPDKNLAIQRQSGHILNPKLFFASWLSFALSVLVLWSVVTAPHHPIVVVLRQDRS